jgi:hypothetical protein
VEIQPAGIPRVSVWVTNSCLKAIPQNVYYFCLEHLRAGNLYKNRFESAKRMRCVLYAFAEPGFQLAEESDGFGLFPGKEKMKMIVH